MTKHDNSDIREELESLAPNLARLPKTNRKSVPEGYFEDVEDQIVRQLNFLHLDQRKPSIPSGYMDSLEDRIVSLVQDEQKVIPLYKKPVVKYLAAASIVLVLAFIGINRWSDNNATTSLSPIASNSTEDAMYYLYLQDNIEDGDIELLIENGLVEESDLSVADIGVTELPDSFTDETMFNSEFDF